MSVNLKEVLGKELKEMGLVRSEEYGVAASHFFCGDDIAEEMGAYVKDCIKEGHVVLRAYAFNYDEPKKDYKAYRFFVLYSDAEHHEQWSQGDSSFKTKEEARKAGLAMIERLYPMYTAECLSIEKA